MGLFLSTFQNKIDKKGRVSVPASFRAVLSQQSFTGIVAYSSFVNPCIEACGIDRMEQISKSVDALDPYSEVRDAFATAILGGSVQLPFDGEGRIILTESLIEIAQLKEMAIFVGKGTTFEIWEPEAFNHYALRARKLAQEQRATLRLSHHDSARE